MTNLDSIFKSRDITLPTKVRLVKTMAFPVIMYGCERWTIKKYEHQRIDAFELWCWRRLLGVPWMAQRSNKSILKEISPECSLEGLVEAETPILWPPDAKSYFSIPSLLTFISASVWEAFCDEFLPWCSVQFSSVDQSCLTLCDPMDYSNPGLPVHHQLLEFTQTHVHRVSDAIQPSHPLSSPSPPAPNPSQH